MADSPQNSIIHNDSAIYSVPLSEETVIRVLDDLVGIELLTDLHQKRLKGFAILLPQYEFSILWSGIYQLSRSNLNMARVKNSWALDKEIRDKLNKDLF